MRQAVCFFLLMAAASAKSIKNFYYDEFATEPRIVRPDSYKSAKPPFAGNGLSNLDDDEDVSEDPEQIEYIEIIDTEGDDSSYSEEDEEDDEAEEEEAARESARAMKRLFDAVGQALADYEDYGDLLSDRPSEKASQGRVEGELPLKEVMKNDDEEMKKIESISPADFMKQNYVPRLAIDPPRLPVPDFSLSKDEEPEEVSKDIVLPVIVKESTTEKESILIPWNISISIDISHLLLIGIAALLLFWVLQKAFSYYHRPHPVIVPSPAEEGPVPVKVPLE